MFAKNRRAFTLIEIMIVVLIIGILLAIAIPNFIRARESSRQKACISNLKQIQSAAEQWAMDEKAAAGDPGPGLADLVGDNLYIKDAPACPSSGVYTYPATVGADPVCSIDANTPQPDFPHQINALSQP
jgi:prepilin-type N-terminal cleavage/methylation domain-containing protein